MNDPALSIAAPSDQQWDAPGLDQSVSEELDGHTEQPLTVRSFAWRVLAIGLNIGLFMVLFQLYKVVRKTYISRGETVGFSHAVQVIDLEKRLNLFFEPGLQEWVLARPDWFIRIFNYYYSYFNPVLYVCSAIALLFGPVCFRFWRRVLISSMVLALPWYVIYPLAPPRFMNADFGYPEYSFVDTLAIYGPQYFKEGGLVTANRFAAMPSMHIGWSTIGALMLACCLPRIRGIWIGAIIGVFHVTMMAMTIMITGNHYWLDAVGGWIVIFLAWLCAKYVVDRLPIRLPKWFSPT